MSGQSPGTTRLFIASKSEDGLPPKVEASAAALADIPEIDGRPNAGFSYAGVADFSDLRLGLARGRFEAGGWVTPHKTSNFYIVVVLSGSGTLALFGENQTVTEISFAAGDVIVLPPATLHQWRNSNKPFDFVGIESSARINV
jgi:mannose-6-phosphate isomerase-like protein (cupin superfamily)